MVTSFQLQMVTFVNYGQLASDAITSTLVNLDGEIFHIDYLDRQARIHCTHGHLVSTTKNVLLQNNNKIKIIQNSDAQVMHNAYACFLTF